MKLCWHKNLRLIALHPPPKPHALYKSQNLSSPPCKRCSCWDVKTALSCTCLTDLLGHSSAFFTTTFFLQKLFFFSSNKEIVVGRRHQLFHQKPSRAPNCKATYTKHSKNIMNYWLLDIWAFHCTTRSKSNMNEATSLKKIKLLYEFSKMLLSLNQNVLLLVSSHKK